MPRHGVGRLSRCKFGTPVPAKNDLKLSLERGFLMSVFPGDPAVLSFFKEVLPGDIRKHLTESSDSGTGGGARDLRVSPKQVFHDLLARMFARSSVEPGVREGIVQWVDSIGILRNSLIELWPPTQSRPNESRIARFYEVGGWQVDEAQFQQDHHERRHLSYVLELHASGALSARLVRHQDLGAEDQRLAAHIGHL